jgi:hypothetical protein
MPRGGSVVSFIPFYKIDTGKYTAGILVKNNLKSGWIDSHLSFISSKISSKPAIKVLAR